MFKLQIMWLKGLNFALCLKLWIYLCTLPESFASLQPNCYPVKAPICSGSSDIISLGISQYNTNLNVTSLTQARRNNARRSVEERDVLPWRYNVTTYPTFADDKSERDAIRSLSALHPLVSTKCSKFIKVFLCSIHSPVCTNKGVVPPCRELCEVVKNDCEEIAKMFDIVWPERHNCDSFPSSVSRKRRGSNQDYQMNGDNKFLISRQSMLWTEALLDNGNVCIPPSDDDVVLPALLRLETNEVNDSQRQPPPTHQHFGVTCPDNMRLPPGHHGHTFMGLPNCTAPCPNMYLDDGQLSIVRHFILVLAIICVLVTSFTLLTFAIDTKRFRYPERPIVFYAFSYLVVSVVYLAGFGLGEQVACNSKVTNENNEVVQGFAVVEGANHRLCSIIFMILYYFTVSGTIWWLILTITWLLAAGFSWGSEAIENSRLYYHAAAWGLPAFQTLIVFISNKIEGDNIAGVCFVGLYDKDSLRYLLLLPMCVYLLIGIVNLFTGFFYLNRVRKKLDGDSENKEKLAKFMLRIGVFSVLYILPQFVLVIIYVIEDINRSRWEATWFIESCADYSVPCPSTSHPVHVLAADPQYPGVLIFCMKYMMTLIVALPPLFWVASRKTMQSWYNFIRRKKSHKRNETAATQTRLLNDSSGPHARDVQAKLQGKFDTPDPVFGEMFAGNLHGSSASVAAQYASNRPSSEVRHQQWEDLTDSDSTEYDTSVMDSELSRVIAFESLKNRGMRITGRKGLTHQPNAMRHTNRHNRAEEYIASGRMASDVLVHKENLTSSSFCRKKDTVPFKEESVNLKTHIVADNTGCKSLRKDSKMRTEKSVENDQRNISSDINSRSQIEKETLRFQANRDKPPIVGEALLQPSPSNITNNSQTSSMNNASSSEDKASKEEDGSSRTSPPPLPPRVDSMAVLKTLSPERALSV